MKFLTKLFVTIMYFFGATARQDYVLFPTVLPIVGFLIYWGEIIYLFIKLGFTILAK